MKSFLFLIFCSIYFFPYAQDYLKTEVTLISPNRDTLWILDNNTGRLIASSWEIRSEKEEKNKPVILMVDSLPYTEKNKIKGYIENNK